MDKSTWTANQVVAFNLAAARHLRGWTQEEAGKELGPYLAGKPWSKGTFSAAERSVDGERIREFTADEILAFSRAFDLPIGFFLLPPHADADAPAAYSGGGESTTSPAEMIEAAVGRRDQWEPMLQRLGSLIASIPPRRRTAEQDWWAELAARQAVASMQSIYGDLSTYGEMLVQLGATLQQLEEAMRREAPNQKEANVGD